MIKDSHAYTTVSYTHLSLINEISNNEKISAKRPITCCIGVSKGYLTNTLDIDEQIKLATKKLQISKQRGTGSCTM